MHRLLPENGDAAGLLALILLTDARRAARTGPNGELIPLDQQDRARWDREAIAEGVVLVSSALSKGSVGEYQLQAAGLALLAPLEIDERMRISHRLDAVRAHLLERAGERNGAIELYRQAASKTASVPERDYLLRKAALQGTMG